MKLFREIGLLSATSLVIGNIISIGILTPSGLIAAELGPTPWLISIWALGGLRVAVGTICYSLLGSQIPRAGGEYAFLYPQFGPLAAFFRVGLSVDRFLGTSGGRRLGFGSLFEPPVGVGS